MVHGSHAAFSSCLGIVIICTDKLLAHSILVCMRCIEYNRPQQARDVLPKCAVQLLSNGYERTCNRIYILSALA